VQQKHLAAPLEELTHRRQRFPRTPSWTCLAGAETREGGRGKRQKGVDSWGWGQRKEGGGRRGEGTEESGRRMDAEISQGHPNALPVTQNVLQKSSGRGGAKIRNLGEEQSSNLVS